MTKENIRKLALSMGYSSNDIDKVLDIIVENLERLTNRDKAIALVNAYFDGKTIMMKDPEAGVPNWTDIKNPEYWSYLDKFCREVDKYKIVEECQDKKKENKQLNKDTAVKVNIK